MMNQMLTIIKQQTEITSLIKGMNSKTDQMRVKLQDCRDVINKKGQSLQKLQESALITSPLPPNFATISSRKRAHTSNDGTERKQLAHATNDTGRGPPRTCIFCSRRHASTQCNRYNKRTSRLLRLDTENMCTYCGSKEHRHINCQHKFRQCKYCTQSHMSALCDLIFVGPRNEFCATTAEALAGNKSQQMHGKLNAVQPSR
uniref:Uncharacterized protein n=1 Tax=Caenorhabditis japonica TaxID=281687 RepID=A0A8R1ID81_CAEJA